MLVNYWCTECFPAILSVRVALGLPRYCSIFHMWPLSFHRPGHLTIYSRFMKPAATQQQTLVKVSPEETPFPVAAAFYKVSAHAQVVVGQSTRKECRLCNQKM